MIHWQFFTDSDNAYSILKSDAPKEFSPIRKLHWSNSRAALAKLLASNSIDRPISTVDDLTIVEHHHIQDDSQLLVSLAHTRGAAAAAVAFHSKNLLAIGIDIEPVDRKIKEHIINKFLNDSDSYKDLLKAWCAKEAAFKASSYFWNQQRSKTFVLKDIKIDENSFHIEELLYGSYQFHYKSDFLICTAVVEQLTN